MVAACSNKNCPATPNGKVSAPAFPASNDNPDSKSGNESHSHNNSSGSTYKAPFPEASSMLHSSEDRVHVFGMGEFNMSEKRHDGVCSVCHQKLTGPVRWGASRCRLWVNGVDHE